MHYFDIFLFERPQLIPQNGRPNTANAVFLIPGVAHFFVILCGDTDGLDLTPHLKTLKQTGMEDNRIVSGQLIKVGIVDDNRTVIDSLREVLDYSRKFKVVMTSRSGHEALERLKHCPADQMPEVIITDVNMPGMSGIDVVRTGTSAYPDIRFVMLTVFDDDETLFEAIKAGASGYLLKGEKAANIVSHLESLMEEGSAPMSPQIARRTLDLLAQSSKPVSGTRTIELEGLSTREKDVLYLLVDGLEYKEIAARLSISPNTVRKHIANVYEKLHISSKAQAIRLMQGSTFQPEKEKAERYRILLVDDHQIILDSLSMMVSTLGNVEIAGMLSDPTDVVPFLNDHPIDLMISDISMPKLDGLSLGEKVRKTYPAIKILMLTVSESPEQIQKAHDIGIEGYVLKKANKAELTQAIRSILSGGTFYGMNHLATA